MRQPLTLLPLLAAALVAQQAPSAAGHWEAAVPGQGAVLAMELKEGAPWRGEMAIQGIPVKAELRDLKVEGRKVTFRVALGGEATFEGTLSEDGKRLEGSAVGPTLTIPLSFGRETVKVANPVQERYTKQEVRIPMRDGVKLFTSIYLPKDTSKPHPILLQRTPYSVAPYGADKFRRVVGPSPLFLEEDYIVAYQDVRGRWMSEGEFVDVRPVNPKKTGTQIDETTDTYDTIDWLVKNLPNNNGKVGQWGISYPGHYTVQGMLSGHPALVAVSPQAPMVDVGEGDDTYHNGAFQLAANFDFFTFFFSKREKPSPEGPKPLDMGTRDGYRWYLEAGPIGTFGQKYLKGQEPVWDDYVKHSTYDAYWKSRDLRPHLKGVKPAVLTVGGWFDAEDLFGPLAAFRTMQKQSPETDQRLVMGPWTHGQWASGDGSRIGTATFGDKTSAWYQKEVELKFFNHHLKGEADPHIAKATIFETGANQWRRFNTWPPAQAKSRSLFLQAQGRLGFKDEGQPTFTEFVSDPAKPVPYTQDITFGYNPTYMIEDQRFAARRPDVAVFESEVLTEDVTLAGPVRPVLRVSTTGTDSDWVVKLIDVFPEDTPDPEHAPQGWHAGGYQMLVRGDTIRGKFREGLDKPKPFVPDQPTEVAVTLPDVCHTFKKGHRIMVQVQCSWFPLVDRNPQTFCDIPNAKPEQFRKATQRVYTGGAKGSHIEVLELK
jgi:hypothetical protein